MSRPIRGLLFLVSILLASPGAVPAQPGAQVGPVISEIQYHPHSGARQDEYVEVENRGDQPVDLSGWNFLEGITFRFPDGVVLEPGETVLVSPDRERTIDLHGLDPSRVTGNYVGSLSDGGEVIHLGDSLGRSIFRVHYRDDSGWPELPDGNGPSLELLPGAWDPYLAESWRSSPTARGTPGEPTIVQEGPVGERQVVPPGATWRYFPGTEEPSPDDPLGWSVPEFDDGAWASGAEPLSYGFANAGTELSEMRGSYSTVYARLPFELSAEELALIEAEEARLTLSVAFDDGFVAYVNGFEIGRDNVPGPAGDPVPFDAVADGSRDSALGVTIRGTEAELRPGLNVIGLHGLNRDLSDSGDFRLSAALDFRLVPRAERPEPTVRINEVRPAALPDTPGFVELFNPTGDQRRLEGFALTDDPHREKPYVFGPGAEIAPEGFLVVPGSALPFPLDVERRVYLLLDASGGVVDAFDADPRGPERSAIRFPDGGARHASTPTPTAGEPNRFTPDERIVINEVHYHPPFDLPENLEFIELHNVSDERVSLAGWGLRGAVTFAFPPDTWIEARGYVVIAADPQAVRDTYGITAVTGPFGGQLSNSGERVALYDVLGNLADDVRYADDGTWPEEPDGSGRTLELAHPAIDNGFGPAWRASLEDGGTPGGVNSSLEAEVTPRVADVRHQPAIPSPSEPVTVTCRVLALRSDLPLLNVLLSWASDTFGGGGEVAMTDDGLSSDAVAGDGVFSGSIPAQENESTVRFEVTASIDDRSSTAPGGGRFFLYEVNSAPIERSDIPTYTILMTDANWRRLEDRPAGSNDFLDATFVDPQRLEVYYNVGVRYRGNGSRGRRINYRVNFNDEKKFHGVKRLNLNFLEPHRQLLANDLFRRAGLPYPLTAPVSLRMERSNQSRYVRVEAYDEEFLGRFFGGDDDGNLYRSVNGSLTDLGGNPRDYDGPYRKITNEEENDFTDLRDLISVFAIQDDDEFASAIRQRADVEEWILYFVANGAMGNNENSILLDAGDDYYLYARPSDGRFVLLPWDSDSQFVQVNQELFRPSSPSVRRFLRHPEFAPLYFRAMVWLQEGVFSREEIERRLEPVSTLYTPGELDDIRSYVRLRHEFLDDRIPRELTLERRPDSATRLIEAGDEWAYWKGTSHPSDGDQRWTELDYDDSHWPVGPSGFGYGDGDDATVFDDMQDNYPTVFVRKIFTIPDTNTVSSLTLVIDYDDGFVAYLNGVEVASRNFAGGIPGHQDTATQDHEADGEERISLDGEIPVLETGSNVLALVGFNGTLDSSDLTLIPVLEADLGQTGLCGDVVSTTAATLRLEGEAPACSTSVVELNGAPATYVAWQARWRAEVPLAPGANQIEIRALDSRDRVVDSLTIPVQRTSGAEELPQSISQRTVLSRDASPYQLSGDVLVTEEGLLEIEAGTRILAGPDSQLRVRGRLVASGNSAEPIVFEPSICGQEWSGIVLEDTGRDGAPSVLEGCSFSSGGRGESGLLQVVNSHVALRDCLFSDVFSRAIDLQGARASIERLEVLSSQAGIAATATDLTLRQSRFEGITDNAITVSGTGDEPAVVSGNVIRETGQIAVAGRDTDLWIERNVVVGAATGLSLASGVYRTSGNLIASCDTGISIASGASLSGGHNTVVENSAGLAASADIQAVNLHSNIIWGNTSGVFRLGGGEFTLEFSDIQGGVWPGPGNISRDPRFVSPESGDFRLQPHSPAVGRGKEGTDMGAFPAGDALFIRGDSDRSGAVNLSDAVTTLLWLFRSREAPPCKDAADVDDNGLVNLSDAVRLLNHLFQGGPPPDPPYPEAGSDPTADDGLDCGL